MVARGKEPVTGYDEYFIPLVKNEKAVRTPWGILLERRSVKELEEILTERLELLRGGEIGPPHLHRPVKKAAKRAHAKKSA